MHQTYPICPFIHPCYPFEKVQKGTERVSIRCEGMKCSTISYIAHLMLHLLQIWRTVYIKVKMVTRAKGHGGTPHPIELTRPGWLAFQLPSAQTGVSNRWTKCKLISAQHTIRGRAGVTTVHNFRHGKRKADVFLKSLQAQHHCWCPSVSSERV